MKYCKKCSALYKDNHDVCSNCKKELSDITEKNTPLYLITANGFEKGKIEGALKDAEIAFTQMPEEHETGATMITGCASENMRFLVPFCAYKKARDILIGIGSMSEDDQIIAEEIEDFSDTDDKPDNNNGEEFNRGATVTLMIIVLLLVSLSVWGVDAIIAWLQAYFG